MKNNEKKSYLKNAKVEHVQLCNFLKYENNTQTAFPGNKLFDRMYYNGNEYENGSMRYNSFFFLRFVFMS